jgi:hypothetical protein
VSRLSDRDVVELEVGAGEGRSVLTGVVSRHGEIFVPTTLAPLKRWDELVEREPAVRMRVGDRIFEGRVELIEDEPLRGELFAAAQRKYGKGLFFADWAVDVTRFFRWRAPKES